MFFVLSKLLYWLILPLTGVITLIIISLVAKNVTIKKRARNIGIGALLFFSNPFFAGIAMKYWEVKAISISELPNYDVGIVLTGIANTTKEPHDRVHFSKGADRLIHAIQLYKQGKIRKILISGGSGKLRPQSVSESQGLKNVAIFTGVREEHIILETEARNTYENAKYCKSIIDSLGSVNTLLITSAFHMRRAQACFKKQELRFDVFSTDINSSPIRLNPEDIIIPTTSALQVWNILIKEWVGMATYKLLGYI